MIVVAIYASLNDALKDYGAIRSRFESWDDAQRWLTRMTSRVSHRCVIVWG